MCINYTANLQDGVTDAYEFLFRYDTCVDLHQALDILLLAMERHRHERHIQICGSASLYYVVKSGRLRRDWNVKVKQRILTTLLNGMLTHREDPTVMRNGCLTLYQFQIPQDVLFDYERLVTIHILCLVPDFTKYRWRFCSTLCLNITALKTISSREQEYPCYLVWHVK